MFRVTLGDKVYGFTFRHQRTEVEVPRTKAEIKKEKLPKFRDTIGTYCEIWDITGKERGHRRWIHEKSVILGVGDTFTRSKGRKYSLARALKYLKFGKNERTIVWDAYHKAHSSERWDSDSNKLVVEQVSGPTLTAPESETKGVGERYANEMD